MQENRGWRKRDYWNIVEWVLLIVLLILSIVTLIVTCSQSNDTKKPTIAPLDSTENAEPLQAVTFEDPNNRIYPYSIMSADWGASVYAEGYTYYHIPRSYTMGGGMFPEVAQIYLWSICKEADVDYYMVLALIERESGYKYYATGDNGNSIGLMQIQEKWHKKRMEALGEDSLFNPYSNMRVGVNYLKEIQDKYLNSSGAHCVLMVYNMGYAGASKLWAEGVYSTAYTQQILQRAQEIKQELQDQ